MSTTQIFTKGTQIIGRIVVGIFSSIINHLPIKLWSRINDKISIVGYLDYPRTKIPMIITSRYESDIRVNSCKKEPDTVKWIETWFKQGDVFYDIGANVGAYSLVAYHHLKGNIKIFAFEPGFTTFPNLCSNIILNKATGAITPLQIALSDNTKLSTFHYFNLFSGGALHALGQPIDYNNYPFTPEVSISAITFSLDQLVEQFNLPKPTHIKLDVDGIEPDILKGAQNIIKDPKLRTVLIEIVHPEIVSSKYIDTLLKTHGFSTSNYEGENIIYSRD